MNNLHSAVDLLPSFVGSVVPDAGTVGWKGACFFENEARLELTEHVSGGGNESSLNGGILHLKVKSRYFILLLAIESDSWLIRTSDHQVSLQSGTCTDIVKLLLYHLTLLLQVAVGK
ncbi:hypothetical protein MUK42_23796 [Musa troglodytarum]|uniref:Uncharacterized protein n=1 Tax=Musa troglodytarum TaxID=320322 RepID=A0A9E7L618_9LILI|nr:hypothetical protein MUK42_23796 [Musa troglodytarum]